MMNQKSRDPGMTLVELLIVMSIIGAVATAIAAVFVIIVRVAPDTEFTIEDARSTRGLQTWLSRDIASTPPIPFDSASQTGFVDEVTSPLAAGVLPGNLCTTSGTHVLFLAWADGATSYRAQYTIEGDSSSGYFVRRHLCGGDTATNRVTGNIENATCAADPLSRAFDPNTGNGINEMVVDLCLVSTRVGSLAARSATSKEITISVTSRNGNI